MKQLVFIIGDDCTANGVTSGRTTILLDIDGNGGADQDYRQPDDLVLEIDWNAVGPHGEIGCRSGYLAIAKPEFVKLLTGVARHEIVRVRARPRKEKAAGMFGGHYVTSSDSRFPFTGPIPVFDRYER